MIPREHRRGVLVYLAISFGLTWSYWELVFFLFAGKPAFDPMQVAALAPGAFAPALATFVVRKWVTREGFGDAGLRLNLKRWRYYLAALIIPFLALAFIITAAPLLGFTPDFTFQRASEVLGRAPRALVPGDLLLFFVIPMVAAFFYTPTLFGEEFGWRGYLQLRLYPGSPLKAAVATGLVWGAWHYPLVWHGRHYTEDNVLAGLICFPIWLVLLSVILGWLRLKSGSIWTACLGHSAVNGAASASLMLFLGGDDLIWAGIGQPLGWVPLAAICAAIVATGQLRPQQSSAA